MSSVDSVNEVILEIKTEAIRQGGVVPGSPSQKALWHLDQAKELMEEGSKENDQAEQEGQPVFSEDGEEGEVSPETAEGTEVETAGVEVEPSPEAESDTPTVPFGDIVLGASASPSPSDTSN